MDLSKWLLARIEVLEALIWRILAVIAPSSINSYAGPIFATQADATAGASGLPAGKSVFITSQRAIWVVILGTAGTTGVPPLKAQEVIALDDGSGVLARTDYSDPKWRVGVNDIYIDPANGAADDENDGLTALTPLATGYELFRRWGWGSKPVIGCNLATSLDGFTTIHVVSDISDPDSLPIVVRIQSNCSLRIDGGASTIIRTSTLTDAVVAMNRAAPLGGTRLRIRDNTLANWVAFLVPNRRVRFTNGPAAGGTLQPQTDQSIVAGGNVDCSACQTTNEPGFALIPTTVTPAVGNTYVIESLVECNLGEIDIGQELNPAFGGFNVFVNFVDINLPTTGTQGWLPRSETGADGVFLNFYQCTIDRIVDVSTSSCLFIACYGTGSVYGVNGCGFNGVFSGGGWNEVGGAVYQIAINSNVIDSIADQDFIANRATVVSINGPIRNMASWNCQGFAGGNAGAHGFVIGGGGTAPFYGYRGNTIFKATLWGSGSAGVGLYISSKCGGIGAPQNITGTTADVKLANNTVGWWWNDATGVYNPVGAGIALSWANITAAEGAAGFGGNAHDPNSQAAFVAVETTA